MSIINYSIIIPHYNVPVLLLRCLRSIPCRNDVEVIIIDDCSENFHICKKQIEKEFAKQNIRIYSTDKNSGPGVARNIGLEHASGKWIIFEDADDLLSEDISKILDCSINRTEDILFCHNKSVMSEDINKPANDYMYEDMIEQYINNNVDTGLRYSHYSVWGRLILRDFIEDHNIRFSEKFYGEDMIFAVQLGHLCNSIAVLPYYLDNVTSRPGSLSRSWQNWGEWYLQFLPAHIEAMHYLHRQGEKILDRPVNGKLFNIMKLDFRVFRTLWNQLFFRDKLGFIFFLIKKVIAKLVYKMGALLK